MPFLDGTGPLGFGPPGRGLGPCRWRWNWYGGYGFWQPRGFGWGWRNYWWRSGYFNPTYYPYSTWYEEENIELTKEERLKLLEEERKEIEKRLEEIKKEIEGLKKN